MRRAMSMDLASNSEEAGGEASSSIADAMATKASRAKSEMNDEKEKPVFSVLLMICIRLLRPCRTSAALVAWSTVVISSALLLQQRLNKDKVPIMLMDRIYVLDH